MSTQENMHDDDHDEGHKGISITVFNGDGNVWESAECCECNVSTLKTIPPPGGYSIVLDIPTSIH